MDLRRLGRAGYRFLAGRGERDLMPMDFNWSIIAGENRLSPPNGAVMVARFRTKALVIAAFACGMLMPTGVRAQRTMGTPDYGAVRTMEQVGSLDVSLKGPNGEALSR